jgi:hypothetical protein
MNPRLDGGLAIEYYFQIINSFSAVAELPSDFMRNMVEGCIHEALDRDKGQDGGDVFAFYYAGREWNVVVTIAHRWAKVMSKDEFEQGEAEGMRLMATRGKLP